MAYASGSSIQKSEKVERPLQPCPMNVLHLNDTTDIRGGAEVYLKQLTTLSRDYGFGSRWLGVRDSHGKYEIAEYGLGLQKVSDGITACAAFIRDYLDRNRIDVIHVHSVSNPQLLDRLFGLSPVVRTMHEPRLVCPGHGKFWRFSESICTKPCGLHCFYHAYSQGCAPRQPLKLLQSYRITRYELTKGQDNYRAIIVMSDYMRNEALRGGLREEKVVLNPCFTVSVPDQLLKPPATAAKKRLLFVGRLSRTKGVHYLIHAADQLMAERDDLALDIVGDGEAATFFKGLGRTVGNDIVFHGWLPQSKVQELLRDSCLLVFPSVYPEAFGLAGIEAMMWGKPVVGFDVGGVTTWLKDGVTGFAVTAKDSAKLAAAIRQILDDGPLYSRMAAAARQSAIHDFSPNRHIKKLLAVYESSLAGVTIS